MVFLSHTPPFPTNLSMCQSPLKWFTWLQTSTTSNPTARLIGSWPWKPRVGSSRKPVRDAIQRRICWRKNIHMVHSHFGYRDVVATASSGMIVLAISLWDDLWAWEQLPLFLKYHAKCSRPPRVFPRSNTEGPSWWWPHFPRVYRRFDWRARCMPLEQETLCSNVANMCHQTYEKTISIHNTSWKSYCSAETTY